MVALLTREERGDPSVWRVKPLPTQLPPTDTSGVGSFSGVLKDDDKGEHVVGGQHQVTVGAALDLFAVYDTDGSGGIEQPEYQSAVEDYLSGVIDKAGYSTIVDLYLRG